MCDVTAWLETLGLSKYAKTFAEYEVEYDILCELTDAHLEDMGLPLGPRLKLLKAIAAQLGDNRDTAQAVVPDASPIAPPTEPSKAERRQLTVMFVDMVGSTALSGQLDPEDLRELILSYHNAVAGEISRFEGHVARLMGDGVLAYFGWPRAHEDEAERAVRAGIAATAAVAKLSTPDGTALATRTGIATGLVVVGDLVGEGAAQEEAVVGETPNLAARLQALARPGTVVIASATRQLLGGKFALEELGQHSLKGIAEPVTPWRVDSEHNVGSRFELSRGAHLAPIIGREEELNVLTRRWQRTAAGDGQVVVISGEAGIGKSRLIRALQEQLEHLGEGSHTALRYQCSPYHANTALYPIVNQMGTAAAIATGDAPERKLEKLAQLINHSGNERSNTLSLFADLLSISSHAPDDLRHLTPAQRKDQTLEALLAQIDILASQRPLLVQFEDVHWADPTTVELLDRLIRTATLQRALILITHRPEFQPPWTGEAHVTSIALRKLSAGGSSSLIANVAGKTGLPEELIREIVEKADGIPLFVEELTQTVLESDVVRREGDRYVLTRPLSALAIPSTLQDSLLARLDRLLSAKKIAQTAAVIGREFSYALIAAVLERTDQDLQAGLLQLADAELVFCRGEPPRALYTFKHALVQDTAYASLLKGELQQLHARVAQVLQERFPERADAEPELLARHHAGAGSIPEAARAWCLAGQRALEHSAHLEALAHAEAGLRTVEHLPTGTDRKHQALGMQTIRAGALLATRGYTAPVTLEAHTRARELGRELGDPPEVFPVLNGLYECRLQALEFGASYRIAIECLQLAQNQNDRTALILANRLVGQSLCLMGRLPASRDHLEQALALYNPGEHEASASVYGKDLKTYALRFLSLTLWLLGYSDQSLALLRECLEHAQRLGYAFDRVHALSMATIVLGLRREHREKEKLAQTMLDLASEHRFFEFVKFAKLDAVIARGFLGEASEREVVDIETLIWDHREGKFGHWEGKFGHFMSMNFCDLAKVKAALGQGGEPALDTIAEGLALAERSEDWNEAELRRTKGELLLAQGEPGAAAEAQSHFLESLEIARAQSAKSWELRTGSSLARLWHDQGKYQEAYDLLAPIYAWFTEGFDTADLRDAKMLLEEIKGCAAEQGR